MGKLVSGVSHMLFVTLLFETPFYFYLIPKLKDGRSYMSTYGML
jgi:hypothetical protein